MNLQSQRDSPPIFDRFEMRFRIWGARALIIFFSLLTLIGCSSTGPAPVFGWGWKGEVPEGYYRVRSGETLSELSKRYNIRLRSLAAWNRLKPPYTIYAGKLLRIAPPNGAPIASAPPLKQPSKSSDAPAKSKNQPPIQTSAASSDRTRSPTVERAGSRLKASGVDWEWPLDGPLAQDFKNADRTRQGIRIKGRNGQKVRAAAAGTVVYSGGGLKGYGNLIIIKHTDKYLSAYGFNRALFVKEGAAVKRGQVLAEVGEAADGAYLLHFEIRRHGVAVDPLLYLPARNQPR